MMKNDPQVTPQRRQSAVARGILALVLVGLLVVPIAVQAELKATELAYSWDYSSGSTGRFEWGHVTIFFDGQWIPLLQEVEFDHLDRPPEDDDPDICPGVEDPERTQYAGWIEYGLPYTDTDPEGAKGFRESRNWKVIDCDLDRDGYWDDDDLLVGPWVLDEGAEVLADCSTDDEAYCKILYKDWVDPEGCPAETEQHCATDLATMLLIRMDRDCDGEIDPEAADLDSAVALCVYSEIQTPDYEDGEDVWTFPMPIRITDADGAKTLMLYPDPTAIELASFNAEPQGRDVLVSWETASEVDNVGFNIYRSEAGGERIRLNDWLIPSQSPGSTAGSSYQFVDRSADPDTAYQYWLEDIDAVGAAGMNGPLAVQMPRHRSLPCRPRPAPIPQIQ